MRPVSIESTLWLFFLYRTSLINAIMNFFLNQKFKNRTKESCSNYIFFEKCLYQIYKEKVFFFSCSRNWNWESNLTCEPKMAQRITWLRKNIFRNLSSTFYFEKKIIKLPLEGSLNLSSKDVLRLKQKTIFLRDCDIYTQY